MEARASYSILRLLPPSLRKLTLSETHQYLSDVWLIATPEALLN